MVGDVKEFGPNHDSPERLYLPLHAAGNGAAERAGAGHEGDPAAIAGAVRRIIHQVEPEMAIIDVKTLEQATADTVSAPRTIARLFAIYAVLAMVIAVIGIGSMLALWVRQRTREIGIRMALGAESHRDILAGSWCGRAWCWWPPVWPAGVAGALAITGFLKKLLFQVEPTDLTTYLAVSALLSLAALLACCIPARRAARIDPQVAGIAGRDSWRSSNHLRFVP